MEFQSIEAVKQRVAAGMGVSVLPNVMVGAELKAGKLAALRWEEPFEVLTQCRGTKVGGNPPRFERSWRQVEKHSPWCEHLLDDGAYSIGEAREKEKAGWTGRLPLPEPSRIDRDVRGSILG